jgi:hypothetical protein
MGKFLDDEMVGLDGALPLEDGHDRAPKKPGGAYLCGRTSTTFTV